MAAIDLEASRTAPLFYRAALSTNWQQFKLPFWARGVSVKCSTSLLVALDQDIGATQPVDGAAASGTDHYITVPADAMVRINVRDPGDRPRDTGVVTARSVFVAASSGTPTLELVVEQAGG